MVYLGLALRTVTIFMGEVKCLVTISLHHPAETEGTLLETVILLEIGVGPSCLGNGKRAWIVHILGVAVVGDILAPQVALDAQEMALLRVCQCGTGIVVIHLLERGVATYRERLLERSVLRIVEIAVFAGSHDGIVAVVDGLDVGASPRHHGGIGRESAFEYFVPTYNLATALVDIFLYAVDEIALQFVYVLQLQALHALLAVGTLVPATLGCFVATDMDVVGREEVDDFIEHILEESKGGFFTGTEIVVGICLAAARNFGVGRCHLFAVAGHLYLGYYRDMSLGGVGQNFTDVVFGVITTISLVAEVAVFLALGNPVHPFAFSAPGGKLSESGIFVYLDAPSRSVGKVKVHHVEFQHGHSVELLQQKRLWTEMA